MLLLDRHNQMLELLDKNTRMSTNELSSFLKVSTATIRSDLNYLEKEGLIQKFHGGAILIENNSEDITFDHREQLNIDEKKQITSEAVKLIKNDQCILLDASSTAVTLAKKLHIFDRLMVVTNGVYTMLALKDLPNITVIFIGGIITKNSGSVEGLLGCDLLKKINADLAFVSAHGFTLETGLTDFNIYESELKKHMLQRAKKTVALLDHSKLENTSIASFRQANEIDLIITDKTADASVVEKYLKAGTNVKVCL